MREASLAVSNYLLFVVLACLLGAMQASLWMHVFGFFPAPYLWMAVLNYWVLYRSVPEGLFMSYLISFAIVTMSGIPLDMALGANICVFGFIYLLRDRVLWAGPNSFMLSCSISALVMPVALFILSRFLEDRSVSEFYFFDWVMRALLTAVFSLPLYYLFSWVDKLTQKEPPKDTESEVL